jgi:hypothetical protein
VPGRDPRQRAQQDRGSSASRVLTAGAGCQGVTLEVVPSLLVVRIAQRPSYVMQGAACVRTLAHYDVCMATKAERFRAEQAIKSSQPKPKKPKARKPARQVDAATDGVTGSGNAERNYKKRPKGGAALEVSAAATTPSRKSTRSSAGHIKQATQLTGRQQRATHSSKARAVRAAARG